MNILKGFQAEDLCPALKSAGMGRILLAATLLGTTAAVAAALLSQPADVIAYVLIMGTLVPAAIAYGITASYDSEVNTRAPELFYDLSEYIGAGGSIIKALKRVSAGSYGTMSDEMSRVLSEVEDEGLDLAAAMKAMAARVNNAYISRSVAVICEALTSSSDLEGILKMVAADGRLSMSLLKERRSGLLAAVVVMYLTTIILLLVVSLCITSLVPMSQQLKALSGGDYGGMESPREFALPYYFLAISVAVCSGLIIGEMRDCSAFGGLKDAAILVTLAFIVFEAVVFPGFNLMEALMP
ncbi:type II secretion system F family protein [Methanocella arvoryzae]|uniref:Bacterial type II secretion system protein, C-terminal n=1 Tax=Methanocella arvoryzae (strain DSM 22066 / NBRC 105507 / MRE50) TaxID=351160 RepID=Q0W6F1_METAR|nr:type II secretion system F family protein [Methanocella arvoryzae]CAJ36042.1 putative bacterial type II secretion system protein, C-terminal fragment [Methanocella arvoryzae MRE50]